MSSFFFEITCHKKMPVRFKQKEQHLPTNIYRFSISLLQLPNRIYYLQSHLTVKAVVSTKDSARAAESDLVDNCEAFVNHMALKVTTRKERKDEKREARKEKRKMNHFLQLISKST